MPASTFHRVFAGAVGAALQALWCAEQAAGIQLTREEITSRFVFLDEQSRCAPDQDSGTRYEELYSTYLSFDRTPRAVNGA